MKTHSSAPRVLSQMMLLRVLTLFLVTSLAVKGEEPTPALTNVKSIRGVKLTAESRGGAVRLDGVVTFADPQGGNFFLQDNTGGVNVRGRSESVKVGRHISITGKTLDGHLGRTVEMATVVDLGPGVFPEPVKAKSSELNSGELESQWVEVEGVPRFLDIQPQVTTIRMGILGGVIEARVSRPDNENSLAFLVDSEVRLRGVCAIKSDANGVGKTVELRVPSLTQLTVTKPQQTNLFDLPRRSVSEVNALQAGLVELHRVRVQGVATLVESPAEFYLQDSSGAVRVSSVLPHAITRGCSAEVVGFLGTDGARAYLEDAVFRYVPAEPEIEARTVAVSDLMTDVGMSHQLVMIEGVLLNPVGGSSNPVMLFQNGPTVFQARLAKASVAAPVPNIKMGGTFQLKGVAELMQITKGQAQSLTLILRKWDDLVMIEEPPLWSHGQLRNVLIGLGVVCLVVFAWITLLRIQVRRQTRIARERFESETIAVQRFKDLANTIDSTLESMTDAVFISNLSGQFVKFNDAFASFHKFKNKAECLTNLSDYPAILDVFKADGELLTLDQWVVPMALRGETGNSIEYTLHRKDTGEKWVGSYSFGPIRNADGAITGSVVVARDMTERKKAVEMLKLSEFSVQNASVATLWIGKRNGRILRVNHATCESLGYTEAELTALTVLDIDPNLNDEKLAAMVETLREKKRMSFETQHRCKDGRIIPVEVELNFYQYEGQEFNFVFARDISERKRVEETLLERKLLLSASQRIAGIGSWSIDLTTQALTWSDETFRLFDVCKETFIPSIAKLIERIHPDDRDALKAQIADFLIGKNAEPLEYRIILADGNIRTLVRRGEIVFDKDHRPARAIGTVQDITLQKKLAEERTRIEEQLRQSQKMDAIGRLAGGIAHDFNNQLAAILGYADMLKLGQHEPKMKRYVDQIKTAALRSADLTRNLLAFARKGQMQNTAVCMHKIIAETISMLEHTIDKRVIVRQNLMASHDEIRGDPSQIQNALLNLAVNARDAMPSGGELLFTTENVECDPEFVLMHGGEIQSGRYICIGVRDTGSGMTDDVKRHLFEPFFTTKDVGKGTGLGLASVYGTVTNHKGTIEVTSQVGHGTQFTLFLPIVDQIGDQQLAADDMIEYPALKGIRVLLVDDEEMLRELHSEMIRSCGMECLVAENGIKAVEIYKQHQNQIDLVIMDMLMPEMNGPDAFRVLKQINPKIMVWVSSGFSMNNDIQTILDEGVQGFIQKPYDTNGLVEKIMAVLA